ncbi:monooxygenase [Seminavis robusta]|uniref:Monooxygenase n=1 Tax=Seminavis robusta TaxID=568900 RepID=A0A9N8HNL8_9STRA|nr:monooxygenase [Seminavis robusta]|eukprot:Sro831_g208390.1 monooxygenase (636) ;mRNA; r:37505-39412
MSATTKSVLIVGAGPSGLAALKEMREVGLEAVAVDSRSQFGGVFSSDSNVTFEDLHLTISNMYMAFSDFPPKSTGCKFWSQAEYFAYLTDYVDAFQLKKHLQLQTTVNRALFNEDKLMWEVSMTSNENDTSTRCFDYLIVAAGANHHPHIPNTDLFKNFQGGIMHASEYHSADQVKGKRVLVVGTGESSADVARSASNVAKSVTLYGRRHWDTAPRFVEKGLQDGNYDENKWMSETHKPKDLLEASSTSHATGMVPLGPYSGFLQAVVLSTSFVHGKNSPQDICYQINSRAWSADFFATDSSVVPTKSAVAITAASKGTLDIVVTPTVSCNGNVVSFHRPSLYGNGFEGQAPDTLDREFDVIVACTGYSLDFDWITTSDPGRRTLNPNPRSWFKHCFPPNFGQHLAFVGFARPHSGGIPQCAELISRYIAQLNRPGASLELPANYADLALMEGAAEQACYHQSPNFHLLVDYPAYMISVAKLVGCSPRIPLNNPVDMVKYWTFPLWPCFFRTQGVGANPAAAKCVLDKFGPWDAIPSVPMLLAQICCAFFMPFVNSFSLCLDKIWSSGDPLPRFYKWRLSKALLLYQNPLTLDDLQFVLMQWGAACICLWFVATKVVTLGKYPGQGESKVPNKDV